MAWFKVDDQFHSSHKLRSIPKRHRMQAAGLWAIAGSWVAGQKTDGFVPDYMIREWGPTEKTVESLVNSGLWSRTRDGYLFNSWLEYNPSKEDLERKRAESKERMRATRERRKTEYTGRQVTSENVALQHPDMLHRNTQTTLQRPDPTRPDPTQNTGTTSQPTFGSSAHDELAGGDPLEELAAATRRARQAGIPEPAIAEGTRRYQAKPEPKGPGLLRTLIDEANNEHQTNQHNQQQREARQQAIKTCNLCDNNGLRPTPGGLTRCNHQTPQPFT